MGKYTLVFAAPARFRLCRHCRAPTVRDAKEGTLVCKQCGRVALSRVQAHAYNSEHTGQATATRRDDHPAKVSHVPPTRHRDGGGVRRSAPLGVHDAARKVNRHSRQTATPSEKRFARLTKPLVAFCARLKLNESYVASARDILRLWNARNLDSRRRNEPAAAAALVIAARVCKGSRATISLRLAATVLGVDVRKLGRYANVMLQTVGAAAPTLTDCMRKKPSTARWWATFLADFAPPDRLFVHAVDGPTAWAYLRVVLDAVDRADEVARSVEIPDACAAAVLWVVSALVRGRAAAIDAAVLKRVSSLPSFKKARGLLLRSDAFVAHLREHGFVDAGEEPGARLTALVAAART